MKRNIYCSTLTKEIIESKVSQELIISKYLNIPLETVIDCIKHKHLLKSVFREDDNNKSMGIAINEKGRLKVRDFGGFGFFEDVYGTVAYVLSLAYGRKIDTNNKQDFYFVLKHIYYTFINYFTGEEEDPNVEEVITSGLRMAKSRKPIIEIVSRSWNKEDKAIWNKWGISLSYLNTHFVVPVDQYYIDRGVSSKPKYYYKSKDPCYAYMIGQNGQGIYLIKLYFPLRNREKDNKFITNCYVLEGLLNLELNNYDYILITKSSKDRLSIGNHLISHSFYGGANPLIGIVNLPSENHLLKQKEYDWLKSKLKDNGKIFSLLDFDKTGRLGAKYLQETYGIPYLFITRGEFGLPNYECKDFAEICERYTDNEIHQFLNETLSYVKRRYEYDGDTYSDLQGLPYYQS